MKNYFTLEELFKNCTTNECQTALQDSKLMNNALSLVTLLNTAREIIGAPIVLSCAYRDSFHNARVGGVKSSQHIQFEAADMIKPTSSYLYNTLVTASQKGLIEFGQLIHYPAKGMVHISLPTNKHHNEHFTK